MGASGSKQGNSRAETGRSKHGTLEEMAAKLDGEMCVHTATAEAEDRGREQTIGSLECIAVGA